MSNPPSKASAHIPVISDLVVPGNPRLRQQANDRANSQANNYVDALNLRIDELESAIGQDTMKAKGLWDDVLVVTYSEFGRRIGENRGGGTDHGTASSQLIMGGRVRGGLYGRHPDLGKLDANGNVAHTTDFRQVYATICQRWWQQNHHPWQGHKTIPFV